MVKKTSPGTAIADFGLYEFRRQLTYKGAWSGCQVFLVDLYYPSTKRCLQCGNVKAKMDLCECGYACKVCGLTLDRDWNAALNLEQ